MDARSADPKQRIKYEVLTIPALGAVRRAIRFTFDWYANYSIRETTRPCVAPSLIRLVLCKGTKQYSKLTFENIGISGPIVSFARYLNAAHAQCGRKLGCARPVHVCASAALVRTAHDIGGV
jgi:hypothetical protein